MTNALSWAGEVGVESSGIFPSQDYAPQDSLQALASARAGTRHSPTKRARAAGSKVQAAPCPAAPCCCSPWTAPRKTPKATLGLYWHLSHLGRMLGTAASARPPAGHATSAGPCSKPDFMRVLYGCGMPGSCVHAAVKGSGAHEPLRDVISGTWWGSPQGSAKAAAAWEQLVGASTFSWVWEGAVQTLPCTGDRLVWGLIQTTSLPASSSATGRRTCDPPQLHHEPRS